MPIVIDTYNCLYAGQAMGGAMADLTVHRICRILTERGETGAVLVLDGRPKPHEPSVNEYPAVHLVYSGTGITADRVILDRIGRSSARKNITVITNDRAVASGARRLGAKTMSCEAFLTRLINGNIISKPQNKTPQLPPQKTTGPSSRGEADHWLKEFGLEPNDAAPQQQDDEDIDLKRLMGHVDEPK